jgi:hypothetical protein
LLQGNDNQQKTVTIRAKLDLADWMPDTARATYGEYNQGDAWMHNSAGAYGDQNVAADDVSDFLSEFNRSTFNKPCPAGK